MPAEASGAAGQEPDEPESRERRRNVGLGRKLVLAVWGVGIVYITLVAFASVIPQALFPERGLADGGASAAHCEETMRTMYASLMAHAAAQTQYPTADVSEDAHFFREWDRQHTALTGQCDESLHANLGRLRHRIQTSLRRYEREEGRLARSLAERLADTDAERASPPEENHP
ncbi:MAG: hypothetical protein IPG17_26215 [Sandaracinaceae bacterium]|jgi:hypothetical protein|nr:hypothetical protein [Sandaracinaceae bacterium]MBP7680858.1 hypothetical protein [Deltaproteobacteria bacterium]MBK7153885.1 hypothetical protein [Sandaracinaceae bacterium]MBK7777397.1 hypothetical protein [Sandaracinaceae bacterium]MBK8408640.1 hypothetical protein [Sandaracinaceae bacterium]